MVQCMQSPLFCGLLGSIVFDLKLYPGVYIRVLLYNVYHLYIGTWYQVYAAVPVPVFHTKVCILQDGIAPSLSDPEDAAVGLHHACLR